MHEVAKAGGLKTIEKLINKEVRVDFTDENGFNPFYIAIERGHKGIIALLKQAALTQQKSEDTAPTSLNVTTAHKSVEHVQSAA